MPFAAPFPDPQLQLPNYEKKLFHNYQNKENILAEFKSFYNNIKLSNDQQALGLCKAVFEHFGDAEAASKIQLSDNSDYNFYKIYLSILSLNPPNLTYKGAIEITKKISELERLLKDNAKASVIVNYTFESEEKAKLFQEALSSINQIVSVQSSLKQRDDGRFVVTAIFSSSKESQVKLHDFDLDIIPKPTGISPTSIPSDQPFTVMRSFKNVHPRIQTTSTKLSTGTQEDALDEQRIVWEYPDNTSSSNQRIGTADFVVSRYHGTHYKHPKQSVELLKKALNAQILKIMKTIQNHPTDGYGDEVDTDYVIAELKKLTDNQKDNLINELKQRPIYSSATVETIYAPGSVNWTAVKADLEKNLKLAKEYAEIFENHINSILQQSGIISKNETIKFNYILDLALVQEIPEEIRKEWLRDPNTSPELKTYLEKLYSDQRVKENRLRVFGAVYYDALKEQEGKTEKEKEALKKDRKSATYAYMKLQNALEFKIDETTGNLLSVEIKNASELNRLLSLKSQILRTIDTKTAEGSYFDNALALSDKNGSWENKLKNYGLPHLNPHNRALGFGTRLEETLSLTFIGLFDEKNEQPEKLETGKMYELRYNALHNEKPPANGKLVVKVYEADKVARGEKTEPLFVLNGEKTQVEGIYQVKFDTYSIRQEFLDNTKLAFVAEWVLDNGFSSGPVKHSHINPPPPPPPQLKQVYSPPSQFPSNIIGVPTEIRTAIEFPLFPVSFLGGGINDVVHDVIRPFGGSYDPNKGFLIPNLDLDRLSALQTALKNAISTYFLNNRDKIVSAFGNEQNFNNFINAFTNGDLDKAAGYIPDNSPLKNAFNAYKNAVTSATRQLALGELVKELQNPGQGLGASFEAKLADLLKNVEENKSQSLSIYVYFNLKTKQYQLSLEEPERFFLTNAGFSLVHTFNIKDSLLNRFRIDSGRASIFSQNNIINNISSRWYIQVKNEAWVDLSAALRFGAAVEWTRLIGAKTKKERDLIYIPRTYDIFSVQTGGALNLGNALGVENYLTYLSLAAGYQLVSLPRSKPQHMITGGLNYTLTKDGKEIGIIQLSGSHQLGGSGVGLRIGVSFPFER